MKKTLLLSMATASVLTMVAGPLTLEKMSSRSLVSEQPEKSVDLNAAVTKSKRMSKHALMQEKSFRGFKFKNLVSDLKNFPEQKVKKHFPKSAETASLYESFEDYDSSVEDWVPEGWSLESKEEANPNPWMFYDLSSYAPGYDGSICAFVNYSSDSCDEWLVSKPVTVRESECLSFLGYISPFYFYNMDEEHFDWDEFDFIGERVVNQTFKVWISEDDGATWSLLDDFSDNYDDYSALDLAYMDSWEKYSYSLDDYAGKTIRVAFEYVGADGNSLAIDAVSVDAPSLEVSYTYPAHTQYFGVSQSLSFMQYSLPIEPVYSPITWTNTSDNDGATYTWTYLTPEKTYATEESRDLTLTYPTDYTSEFTTRNNLYLPPTLTGSMAGAADGEFSRCDYFQVGGKAQFELTNNTDNTKYVEQYGFSPLDCTTEGLSVLTQDMGAVPLFGYSEASDEYWTNYSFPDEDDRVDGNYAYVDGIMNIYQPAEAPMVIEGAWLPVYGCNLTADHEFTLEIIPLTDEGELSEPIATAVSKGGDATVIMEKSSKSYYNLAFTFDEPVVMSREVCNQYVVRLTGIHEAGEYFAPFQSTEDNPDGLYVGVVQKKVSWMYNENTSLTMIYKLLQIRSAFAIMLDATYPWLQGEEEVSLEDNVGSLSLDSYYDGSVFEVEAPEWLNVQVAGVNDKCVATFTVDGEATSSEAEVTLSVPGFKKVVNVKNITSGVSNVTLGSDNSVKSYVSLSGVNLGSKKPTEAGVYLVRYANGKVGKVTVK